MPAWRQVRYSGLVGESARAVNVLSSRWGLPLGVLLLAISVRAAFLLLHPLPLASDALDYDQLGWTLARTGHYATNAGPTAFRAPGYPAAVAGVYHFAGHNPQAVRWVQILFDSLTAFYLYRLLAPRNRAAAAWAGYGWALFPAAVLFSSDLWSETFFTFGAVRFLMLLRDDEPYTDRAAGLLLGALILMKPMMLLVAAALPVVLSCRPSRRAASTILIVALIPVFAWMTRNLIVMGTPALVTSAGANLWIGNHPGATGGYTAPPAIGSSASHADEVASDRTAGAAAIRWIAAHPAQALAVSLRKVALVATSEAELTAGAFTSAHPGVRLRDRYRAVPVVTRVIVSLPSLFLLIIGVLGMASRRHDDAQLEIRIFAALLMAILVSSFVFFGSSRFRFPLMPFFVLFGAQFLGERVPLHQVRRRDTLAAAAVAVLILAIWIAEGVVLFGSPTAA